MQKIICHRDAKAFKRHYNTRNTKNAKNSRNIKNSKEEQDTGYLKKLRPYFWMRL